MHRVIPVLASRIRCDHARRTAAVRALLNRWRRPTPDVRAAPPHTCGMHQRGRITVAMGVAVQLSGTPRIHLGGDLASTGVQNRGMHAEPH